MKYVAKENSSLVINKHERLPENLLYVLHKKENFQVLKNNTEVVKNFIKSQTQL